MRTFSPFFITTMLFYQLPMPLALGQTAISANSRHEAVIDTFHNRYILHDRFRWLEEVNSPETLNWIQQQNRKSKKYLKKASTKTNSPIIIDKFNNAEYDNPVRLGNYYFTYAYYQAHATPALFYQSDPDVPRNMLINPNEISRSDNITLTDLSVSKDSKLLAYQFSRNGSDWQELKVISLRSRIHTEDHLTGLRYSRVAWFDQGFYYSTYEETDQFGETLGQKIYYHKIGTEQSEDQIIFERKNNPRIQFDFLTSSDERYLLIKEINEHRGLINVFYLDHRSGDGIIKPLVTNVVHNLRILDSYKDNFIAVSLQGSNIERVVEIDPNAPFKWKSISPELPQAQLVIAHPFEDRIVTIYRSNHRPLIIILNYEGDILYKLELPLGSSVRGFHGGQSDEEVYFSLSSYTMPPVVYKFNLKTFERTLAKRAAVNFDHKETVYKEVFCTARDGVQVPIMLVFKEGLKLDGKNPLVLKAYGGFGAIATPSFDAGATYLIDQGGVFAFANIRGGGDKGVQWAMDGRGPNKQRSFEDFIDCAEFLVKEGYTNKRKLAAYGISNGGLVVAASAIQRPDLFRAVVPVVAPLDMLRFENFTVGHFHVDEYGTTEDSLSFTRLYRYSPYQNIRKDVNYPSMLIVTSDNDDRVPPFHSYKFAARLQNRPAQKNPILLKVEKQAGHYGPSTPSSTLREKADIYGFIMNELTRKL